MDDSKGTMGLTGRTPRTYTTTGVIVSLIYVGAIGFYVWNKWSDVGAMSAHDFAEFLAAIFGPVTFFWLILGYLQQGAELRSNSLALHMQARELEISSRALINQVDEMRASVDEQRKMTELASAQLEHQVRRSEQDAAERLAKTLPLFMFGRVEMYAQQAPGIAEFVVQNSGASVVVLAVLSNSKDDSIPLNIGRWETSQIYRFVPFRSGRPPDSNVEIQILYRHEDGTSGRLLIEMDRDGQDFSSPRLEFGVAKSDLKE